MVPIPCPDISEPVITNEVWEVKRLGGGRTCTKQAAMMQLANYVTNGILQSEENFNPQTGGTSTVIEPNVFEVSDKDEEGMYVIAYWDGGDGIIFYDYVNIPSKKEVCDVLVGALGVAAYLGLAYYTGGISLGLGLIF